MSSLTPEEREKLELEMERQAKGFTADLPLHTMATDSKIVRLLEAVLRNDTARAAILAKLSEWGVELPWDEATIINIMNRRQNKRNRIKEIEDALSE